MKVKIDPDLCAGCAVCVEICPEVFEMEDDLAVCKMEDVPAGQEDAVQESADDCPAEAIIIS